MEGFKVTVHAQLYIMNNIEGLYIYIHMFFDIQKVDIFIYRLFVLSKLF